MSGGVIPPPVVHEPEPTAGHAGSSTNLQPQPAGAAPSPHRSPVGQSKWTLRLGARVLWVGFATSLIAFFPGSPYAADRFSAAKELVAHVTALAATAAVVRPGKPLRLATDYILTMFLVISVLAAAYAAENRWLAIRSVGLTASGILIYRAAKTIGDPGAQQELLFGIAAALGGAAATALAEAYGLTPSLALVRRVPAGPMGSRNALAHVLALGTPLLLHQATCAPTSIKRRVALIATVLAGAALALTRSRGAWLALLIVAPVAAWVCGSVRGRAPHITRAAMGWAAAFTAGFTMAVTLPNALEWRDPNPMRSTLWRLVDASAGSGRGRLIEYETTWHMIHDHPTLGVGPGNWALAYPVYAQGGDPNVHPRHALPTDRLAQGDWIGTWAERGSIALGLLGLYGVLVLRGAFARVRGTQDLVLQAQCVLSSCVILVLFVLGAVDAVIQLPVPALLCGLVLGSAEGMLNEQELTTLVRPAYGWRAARWTAGGAALAAAAALALGTWQWGLRLWVGPRPTLERLTWFARLDPSEYEARIMLANRWAQQRRCDLARRYIAQARSLQPTAAPPRALAARCDLVERQ